MKKLQYTGDFEGLLKDAYRDKMEKRRQLLRKDV